MKKEAGFTLIELLLVVGIMGLVLIFGFANYTQYNRKKILEEAAWNLMNNLRYAQAKALSGEKPSGCNTLQGWQLRFIVTGYQIEAVCTNDDFSDKNFSFPDGVSKESGANSFLFKLLGHGIVMSGGGGEIVLRFTGHSKDYKIIVNEMGEISNEGFQ